MLERVLRKCRHALLGVVVLGAVGCKTLEETKLEAGRRALGRGSYRVAIDNYREVILQAPQSREAAQALYEQGVIYYLKLRDLDSAQANFKKVLTEHSERDVARDARRMLARIYQDDLRAPVKAIREYLHLLEQVEDPFEEKAVLLSIANRYYVLNELERASEFYRRVVEQYRYGEDSDLAFIRLAHIEGLLGREEEALAVLQSLLGKTDDPDSRHRTFLSAAELHMLSGRYEDARTWLVRADREFPDDASIHELAVRLRRQETDGRSLDDGTWESQMLLEELQRNISWGRGTRARRARR